MNKLKLELDFLRYFYMAAGDVFGPASGEIYSLIKQDYAKYTGKELPDEYKDEDEEED